MGNRWLSLNNELHLFLEVCLAVSWWLVLSWCLSSGSNDLLWRATLCFVGVSSLPNRCKLLPSSPPRRTCDNQKCPQLLSNDFVPGNITPRWEPRLWIPKADLLTTVVGEPTTDKLLPSLVLRFCESVKLFFCSDGYCLRSVIVNILLAFQPGVVPGQAEVARTLDSWNPL